MVTKQGSLVVIVAALVAACGAKARPPLDPALAPEGVGWSCYQHEAPGTVSLGICYRDRAECAARATEDGNTTCTPTDQAFCADLQPRGGHEVRCLATAEDCEEVARGSGGAGASACVAVP